MPTKLGTTLSSLVEAIALPLPGPPSGFRNLIEPLFGERYQVRHKTDCLIRDAYALGNIEDGDGVPYAGIIHPDNPTSGPYGGTSLVWFPTSDAGTLIGLGI